MGATAEIPEEEIARAVEEHWRMRRILQRLGPNLYPETVVQVLGKKYPVKAVRWKIHKMSKRGALEFLLTLDVPGEKVNWSKVRRTLDIPVTNP